MRFSVAEIARIPGERISFEVQSSEVSGMENSGLAAPIEVRGWVRNAGEGVLMVEGSIKTRLTHDCSRCLRQFTQDVELDFSERYSKKQSEDVFSFEGDTIDLTDMVRELLLSSIPIRSVCSDECRGLCQHCGADLNIKKCNCSEQPESTFAALAERYEEE